jgi:hypothetical protein
VVAGSIGLEPLARQAGLSATLNTLSPFHLKSWSRETAAGCLRELASSYGIALGEDSIGEMLDRLRVFIPHHVEMFFEHLYQAVRLSGQQVIAPALVGEVYQHSMLGIRGHAELSHMEERLRTVLGTELNVLALDLLTEAAVMKSLTQEAATALARDHFAEDWRAPLRTVLDILEHDGYLAPRGAAYVFESGLLRDWWHARFAFAYVPAAERKE